jgi:hypothetical protein
MVNFGVTIGSSIIEMKVTVPLGTEEGELQCSNAAATVRRARLGISHTDALGAVALRQNSLSALILVVPSSIDTLSDAFSAVSNTFDFRSLSGGGSGGGGGSGAGQSASQSGGSTAGSSTSGSSSLAAFINSNTITIAVVAAVTASVANVVAASTVSNSASLMNAFQIIGHAQCEYFRMQLCLGVSAIHACVLVLHCLFS